MRSSDNDGAEVDEDFGGLNGWDGSEVGSGSVGAGRGVRRRRSTRDATATGALLVDAGVCRETAIARCSWRGGAGSETGGRGESP